MLPVLGRRAGFGTVPEHQHEGDEVALRSNFSDGISRIVDPLGGAVARTGVSPNMLTTLGLLLTTAGALLVGTGRPFAAGWVLVFGGLMDTFDGAVARARNRSTPFGGFYDSVSDRLSDGIILGGVAWWVVDRPRLFLLTIAALVAAEVTSYVRAKAEAIDLSCDIGVLERAERAILIMAGLVFHQWLLEPVLWVLAVGGVVTVVQRVHHVWCQIDRDVPEELLVAMSGDRAWNRAFLATARRLYGRQNFDAAMDDLVSPDPPPSAP